ncbi:snRNA-activating protein complex subunit 5 [Lepisosteus oculatus]|uniref:Small nuclear RNA activating complex, polypeptide 5 n=1 Tax=Lepisosteus oculatus TaxID=7918 RepID=W5N918_LEPOC|nr:PREDICTED: snRNA-activating protein complex subunit 5 [Lepisosteus oculatus]XP_015198649.1 PREDICTED: snRNA-activating protein complex subunit 5 [Lepisosteus oculatus]
MLSRLQELKKEEETLLKVKAMLQDQLTRLKVEELTLRSMISTDREGCSAQLACTEGPAQLDNESQINQTELRLTATIDQEMEEDEEEEEED